MPAGIQDEIRLKNRLRRRWQVTRDPALKAEVNRLQRSVTGRLNERRNDQWSETLHSLDPVVEDGETGDESPYSVSPWSPRGESLSQTEKAEALADSLETQFQPVTDPSVPAVIEMVDVALRSYFTTPSSEPKLANPEEVQDAIRCLKVSKAPGPNGIPNRALKHLPLRAVTLLQIFNAVLLTHHFSTVWKRPRMIFILKQGKDSALPSPYRPISLLDTIGKLFENILFARILHEVSER
jgi:hypothetical protein